MESKTKGKKIGMNTNDKKLRITIRLNEEEHAFLEQNADMLGITPSELLRQVIHVSMRTTAAAGKKLNEAVVNTTEDVRKKSEASEAGKPARASASRSKGDVARTTTTSKKRPTNHKEK